MEARDRQAQFVVEAIRDLAAHLEYRRERLNANGHDTPAERARALNDIDRLSNLVSLAISMPQDELQDDMRLTLGATLHELRRRISRIGTGLTIARIRDLRAIAEGAVRHQEHPLGKSFILRRQFTRYVGYLIGLADGLSAAHEEEVRATAAAINALIAFDRDRGALDSFSEYDEDLPPIDMDRLALPHVVPAA